MDMSINDLGALAFEHILSRHHAASIPGEWRIEALGVSVALYKGEQLVAGAKDTDTLATCVINSIYPPNCEKTVSHDDDLTVTEVADSLGLKPGTVRKKCLTGDYPGAYKDGQNGWRIPIDTIVAGHGQRRKPGRATRAYSLSQAAILPSKDQSLPVS